jgi:hypothetical protein
MAAETETLVNGLGKGRPALQAQTGTVSFVHQDAVVSDHATLEEWNALLDCGEHLNRLYASPVWFAHLCHTKEGSDWLVGLVRDEAGRLVGACPLQVRDYSLPFGLWKKTFAKVALKTAFVPPAEPLLPKSPDLCRRFFDGIFSALPECDCVFIPTLRIDRHLWEFLRGEGRKSANYIAMVYAPYGVRTWRWLELKGSFKQYLSTMDRKTRYKLRKFVRDLQEQGKGPLECVRVVSEDQIQEFLCSAVQISEKSWQHRELGPRVANTAHQAEEFKDLAGRGLLRCYLLKSGNQAIAFVIGYQFEGVFHYVEIAYDEAWAEFSPGTVLLYMLIEDLFQHDSPRILEFGSGGDLLYKRRFSTNECEDATLLLFRRTVGNQVLRACFLTFSSAVRLVKRLLRKETKL